MTHSLSEPVGLEPERGYSVLQRTTVSRRFPVTSGTKPSQLHLPSRSLLIYITSRQSASSAVLQRTTVSRRFPVTSGTKPSQLHLPSRSLLIYITSRQSASSAVLQRTTVSRRFPVTSGTKPSQLHLPSRSLFMYITSRSRHLQPCYSELPLAADSSLLPALNLHNYTNPAEVCSCISHHAVGIFSRVTANYR
ncbi:hypothetical protein J6590_004930 [Homalodisca vitripennis]|nr:hypothetical protein J6590_004930 [Homalodisca vitripennis]